MEAAPCPFVARTRTAKRRRSHTCANDGGGDACRVAAARRRRRRQRRCNAETLAGDTWCKGTPCHPACPPVQCSGATLAASSALTQAARRMRCASYSDCERSHSQPLHTHPQSFAAHAQVELLQAAPIATIQRGIAPPPNFALRWQRGGKVQCAQPAFVGAAGVSRKGGCSQRQGPPRAAGRKQRVWQGVSSQRCATWTTPGVINTTTGLAGHSPQGRTHEVGARKNAGKSAG